MKIEYKINGVPIEPVYVKHLGRYRIPTLFPYLLEAVARLGFEKVDFVSSNPWDFSDALIDVIAQNDNITRTIHLPVQSGDDAVLRRMNRWYTSSEYLSLINKIKSKVKGARFTTDIIVGFAERLRKNLPTPTNLHRLWDLRKHMWLCTLYAPQQLPLRLCMTMCPTRSKKALGSTGHTYQHRTPHKR